MRLSIITLTVVVCSAVAWIASAAVVQTHYGDTVPTGEGWTKNGHTANGTTWLNQAVPSDTGYGDLPAWKIADLSGGMSATYSKSLGSTVLGEAASQGWKLTAKLRVDGAGYNSGGNVTTHPMLVDFGGSGPANFNGRWVMRFGSDDSGNNALINMWNTTGTFSVAGNGYHQYDLIDSTGSGSATLYVDGTQIATGIGMTDSYPANRVLFGDGHTTPKGNANYNYVAFETGANLQPVQLFEGPTLNGPGVLYTFEGDLGKLITDKLVGDGSQNPILHGSPTPLVDTNPANAAFGDRSVVFPTNPTVQTTLTLPGSSSLGSEFTLAAMVKETDDQIVSAVSRLFTTYNGSTPDSTELIFDIDPTGQNTYVPGVRFIHNGVTVKPLTPITFNDGEYHHLAATYSDGDVVVYLDGNVVASGDVGGGPVNLFTDLKFGEEGGPNEPFEGYADDILLVRRALTADEIEYLATHGAESAGFLIPEPSSILLLLIGLPALLALARRRRG